jgi:superfamily I DNA/RNA helicase/RecB family exonuclease
VTIRESRIGLGDWPAAIERTDGYQMVVAGPGTGKSELLVKRVAHLLEAAKARPGEIVVLCFSRRAAAALRNRIGLAAGNPGAGVDATTFHSLALRLTEKLGVGPTPSPLTTPEQIGFVAGVLADERPDEWPMVYRGILTTTAFAAEVADFLMRCSERLLSPDDLASRAVQRADWRGLPGLFRRYLDRLGQAERTDYGVLLASTAALLQGEVGKEVSAGYRYVLVDEYQDTTPAQAEIARLLAGAHHNLTVAGDPYQSIYSFRGAELRNVAEFTQTHPDAERLILTESLRVPAEIMTAALRVVSGGDLPGAAGPVTPAPHPGRCEAYVFDQETGEAEWIAGQVEQAMVIEGTKPSQIAVLVRSKREALTELSRALDRRGIPHDPPQSRLIDHPAVQLVHDLVILAVTGGSLPTTTAVEAAAADRAMRRVLLGPLVGLGLGRERSLLRARRRTWEPWHQVIAERLPENPGLGALLQEPDWATVRSATDGFWHLWTTLDGLEAAVADVGRGDWRRAWAAFAQSLARQAERDPSMTLARYFALTEDDDFEAEPMLTHHLTADRVTLTTLHQAKGLEFELVFIANASEGVFPDLRRSRRMLRPELLSPERTIDPHAIHLFQLQEEMRLAYTAMTRARSRVVLTATSAGIDQGERRPSRFLVAASGTGLDQLGPPEESDRDPITVNEAEIMLRRLLLDPAAPAPRRLAAATTLSRHADGRWEPHRFAGVSAPGPDRPILGETIRLSPSQAESYQSCPRRYALERRLRLSDGDSQYTMFGSLIHDLLERAEREVIGTGARHAELGRALELLDEVWEEASFGTPQLDQAWKAKAVELLERLYQNWPGAGPPVAVEREVATVIEGVDWVGKIDRVEQAGDGVRVVDYKTTTRPLTYPEAAGSVQLGFYATALATEGRPVVDAQFWYPRADSKAVTTRPLDMSALDTLAGEMRRITRSVLAEDWAPRVGSHCDRCDFRGSCPAWPEGRGAYLP